MDETANRHRFASVLYRDPAVSILFGVALLLIPLIVLAGARFAASGHAELLQAVLLLTGAFSIVGMVLGLVRSLRSARTITRPGA